jgi:hypothetical protein
MTYMLTHLLGTRVSFDKISRGAEDQRGQIIAHHVHRDTLEKAMAYCRQNGMRLCLLLLVRQRSLLSSYRGCLLPPHWYHQYLWCDVEAGACEEAGPFYHKRQGTRERPRPWLCKSRAMDKAGHCSPLYGRQDHGQRRQ